MKSLKWARRLFQNEREREIYIEIGDCRGGEVLIRMTGPETISENFVTRLEAENLRDALVEWSAK